MYIIRLKKGETFKFIQGQPALARTKKAGCHFLKQLCIFCKLISWYP
ncbi:hypothetical protein HMPREF9176_2028 [Streptococcus downei F0415]|nr:hypothetical protein HMPREF9176_2028 [Streptococcus downei F0415]